MVCCQSVNHTSSPLLHRVVEHAESRHDKCALSDLFLQAAHGRLDSADVVLKGPEGRMKYRPLHAQLVGRRCRMACTIATVYSVGPQTGAELQFTLNCLSANFCQCRVISDIWAKHVSSQAVRVVEAANTI